MLNTYDWLLDQDEDILSLDKWQKTVNLITRIFQAPAGFIVQYDNAKGFKVIIASELDETPYSVGDTVSVDTNIFCKQVVLEQQSLYVKNALLDNKWHDNPEVTDDGFKSYLGLPILRPNGSSFGTMCVMDFKDTDYQVDFIEVFEHLRDVIEDDLVMVDNFCKMREMAMLDPLTQINNRRAFMLLGEQKLKLSSRMNILAGVLFIDINDFKRLNDNFGHDVGDQVLKVLAFTLKHEFREVDVIGRLGGDEFVVVLHIKYESDLTNMIINFKNAYAHNLNNQNLPKSSLSVGKIICNKKQCNLIELLEHADQNMYENKGNN